MTRPVLPHMLVPHDAPPCARLVAGLPDALDAVAEAGPASHRFLRRGWFAAAARAYGGEPNTVVATCGEAPVLALPVVRTGPRLLGLVSVPGCYWPFRSFPARMGEAPAVFAAVLATLATHARALRIGPVYDGDASVTPLLSAARAGGWTVMARDVATSFLLDIADAGAEAPWPRGSTLRKNRFHEKHLAAHGALDWRFVGGHGWTDAAFAALAAVEAKSWIAARTDGRDAKFTAAGHGAFWRAAAEDPAIAAMMWAAVLEVDGQPAAFSFDLNAGETKYAIANSYDPAFAKHSPGKLLYYRNLVRGVADGIRRVDWGAGDSGYKRTIGAAPGPAIRDWLLVRPGIEGRVARALTGLWARSGNRLG